MFLGLVALSVLIIAVLTRRPVARLLARRFSHIELLWVGALLHVLFVPAALAPVLGATLLPGLPKNGGLVYIASLFSLLAFCWLNRRYLGVLVIGFGLLLNTLVITANGGHMPCDQSLLEVTGIQEELQMVESSGTWSSYAVAGPKTRFALLCDRILVPRPLIPPMAASVGDFVIALGIVLFIMVIPEGARARGKALEDSVSTA